MALTVIHVHYYFSNIRHILADGESDLVTIGRRLRICTHFPSSSGWSSLHLPEHFVSLCKVVRNSTPGAKSTAFRVCCFTCNYFYFFRATGGEGNFGFVWCWQLWGWSTRPRACQARVLPPSNSPSPRKEHLIYKVNHDYFLILLMILLNFMK